MSKYKILNSPVVPNMPWQDGPAEFNGAPVWRYSQNPIIGRNPLPGVARIFNSAVVPYNGAFIGVFRGEQTNGIPYIYLGHSEDAIHWTFDQEKIHFGVPSDIIEKYSVYSKETAEAMAKAAGNLFTADVSIGITGTAGNADPNNISSIPGEVYFAIKYKADVSSYFVRIPPQCSRLMTKLACAEEAYEKLVEILK